MLFAGDSRHYAGWVLAHDADTGKHNILYDDGEDEWADLSVSSR